MNDRADRALSLKRGESQFAILEPEHLSNEMQSKNLKPEQYVMVASPKWKNRKLKDIINNERIVDFDADDQITFHYLKKFNLFDDAKKERHYANRTASLPLLISNELGYGVLPLEFARPYLINQELIVLNNQKIYEQSLVLAWFFRPYYPDYLSAIISTCC